ASQFPIEWAFYLDALSFVLSALCILLVQIAPLEVEGKTNIVTVIRNLREGARFLYGNVVLRSLMLVSVPILFGFGLWNVLLLPFATRALQATEFEYGLQEGLTSVGFVIGSLLMVRLADRLREGQWLAIGFLGMAMIGIIYSQTVSIPLAIGLVMLSGFINAPSAIARRLLIQRNAPREVRGRVNSAFFVSRDIVFLLGMAAAGLADLLDVRLFILGSALLMLASGLLALVLPGLGQPAAEWKKALSLLRAAPVVPELGVGRAATLADL
ncbi:MAG: MFS transporter, partial [Candidatus Latescibacteria bacterium]|nr:MFS transporter [Candidatus Latescibacterota bacterium]